MAAAQAAGHLVAALVNPLALPFLAVGNTALDLTPHPSPAQRLPSACPAVESTLRE
ncbi:hypothetical protein ABZX92_43375 [Lentzea sp. NPDC006480]|uniref:hypothetical protein n=1 Tax=Lentzea sp. NPDC006480 TaxID=3157176 RepID=UPI0033B4D8BE